MYLHLPRSRNNMYIAGIADVLFQLAVNLKTNLTIGVCVICK
jgi:hypothetical protein